MSEPRSPRSLLPLVFVGLAIALVALGVLLRRTAPEPEARLATGAQPISVSTLRVTEREIRPRTQVAGLLEEQRRVGLFAEVSGKVLEIGADELDRVEVGQLLVRIDPLVSEVGVARAEAALARAKSELALARANRKRQGRLAGSAVASESALDTASNAERVAEAALREASAVLDEARDRLEKTEVRAPFSGVLRSFPVEAGEYVQPGEKIGEILDTSRLRVTVGLSDREVVAVASGLPARVVAAARPGEAFPGEVTRVGAAADLQTRKFPVQVEIENSEGRLLPGMVVRIDLELAGSEPRRLVPRDAIAGEFGLHFGYVLEPDVDGGLVVRRRRVEVRDVPFLPTELDVVAGLRVGEEIAVTSLRQLRDGTPVARSGASVADAAPGGGGGGPL